MNGMRWWLYGSLTGCWWYGPNIWQDTHILVATFSKIIREWRELRPYLITLFYDDRTLAASNCKIILEGDFGPYGSLSLDWMWVHRILCWLPLGTFTLGIFGAECSGCLPFPSPSHFLSFSFPLFFPLFPLSCALPLFLPAHVLVCLEIIHWLKAVWSCNVYSLLLWMHYRFSISLTIFLFTITF